MTKDEALQMCLEYIETDAHERKYVRHAIKQALAAPPTHKTARWTDEEYREISDQVISTLVEYGAELDATNRQVEILSDALAESRREVAAIKQALAAQHEPENEPFVSLASVQEPDLIARLTNPEQHYEFTDPKKANAVLMSLCQEAADALAAPVQPVAWGCNRYIEDGNGFQIGADEPELAWGKYAPDDNGWWPLYTTPPAQPAPVQEPALKPLSKKWKWVLHESFADVAGFDEDGIPSFYWQESVTKFKSGELSVPCKGKNCGSMNGWLHSAECRAEHEAQYTTPPAQPAPVQPVAICPQTIIHAITEYGDARADQDANNAPTTSHERLADCIRLIRAAQGSTPPAQPAVPDAMTSADIQEHIEYVAGWNDCRAAMLEMMKARGNT